MERERKLREADEYDEEDDYDDRKKTAKEMGIKNKLLRNRSGSRD